MAEICIKSARNLNLLPVFILLFISYLVKNCKKLLTICITNFSLPLNELLVQCVYVLVYFGSQYENHCCWSYRLLLSHYFHFINFLSKFSFNSLVNKLKFDKEETHHTNPSQMPVISPWNSLKHLLKLEMKWCIQALLNIPFPLKLYCRFSIRYAALLRIFLKVENSALD